MNQASTSSDRRYHPLLNLTLARLREFVREPHAVFWVYIFPLLLMSTLGIAFRNRPLDASRIAVVEGPQAESICATLNADPRFQAAVVSEQEARLRFRTTRADLMLIVPADGSKRYEYFYDSSRVESVLARKTVDDYLQQKAGRQNVVAIRDHEVDEPGGHYTDFLVPGLLGMGLLSGGLWGVGYAVVDMRIRKLLKHYFATPMKRSHFLAAVMISRLLFTVTEVLLLLVFARFIFGVTNQGSYLALGLVILLGAFEFSGLGLLIASRAQTMETVSGLMNAVLLPMWVGSGIFFSTERFPEIVQPALVLLPLTPLIHSLRSIMLEGTSLVALSGDLALITAWGCGTFILALRWFRWK
jgi:ABC-type multidrug transport system permease subunit